MLVTMVTTIHKEYQIDLKKQLTRYSTITASARSADVFTVCWQKNSKVLDEF